MAKISYKEARGLLKAIGVIEKNGAAGYNEAVILVGKDAALTLLAFQFRKAKKEECPNISEERLTLEVLDALHSAGHLM